MNFAEKVIKYYEELEPPRLKRKDVGVLFPYDGVQVQQYVKAFYRKFFSDHNQRNFVIGINPGRFGAGITGIPFTDPVNLKHDCGIDNQFDQRSELSSQFIYEMIKTYGGPKEFYAKNYVTSVCPVGFTLDSKNLNYYDEKKLENELLQYITTELQKQIVFGVQPKVFCLGAGKNFKFLTDLNKKLKLFNSIEALPHPRYVLQYKRKMKEKYIADYCEALS